MVPGGVPSWIEPRLNPLLIAAVPRRAPGTGTVEATLQRTSHLLGVTGQRRCHSTCL